MKLDEMILRPQHGQKLSGMYIWFVQNRPVLVTPTVFITSGLRWPSSTKLHVTKRSESSY